MNREREREEEGKYGENTGKGKETNSNLQGTWKIETEVENRKNAEERSYLRPMTISEAAVFLNIKVSKLRSMVFRKEIPFLKFGRLVRFRAQDLETWMLARRSSPPGFGRGCHDTNSRSFIEIDTRFSKANSKGLPCLKS